MSSQPKDQKQSMLDTLLANIIHSSAIEDEKLNAFSVRSSLANKLGVSEEKPFPTSERTDGLAEMVLDAVENLDSPLSLDRILQWHKRLFPEGYTLFNPVMGGKLRGDEPMQVVSGRIDKPRVHFEAPSRGALISVWFMWFLNALGATFTNVLEGIDQTILKTNFWLNINQSQLSLEQVKVLNRMLDGEFEQGINTSQYH